MYIQDLFAAPNIRQRDIHLAVKTTGAQQSSIQNIRPVGGGHHNHADIGFKAVHLDQHLVEGLLTLVVATAQASAPLAAYRVNLVNENNAGGVLFSVVKHVAHTGCTHTDKHFHKV